MSEKKINILYVDDEENNLVSFKAVFRIKYQVFTAIDTIEAMKILEAEPVEIIITDQRMPNMTGTQFLEKVLERFPDPMRILLTGYSDISAVTEAVNKGKIYHYLTKPWNEEELDATIKRAFEAYEANQQLKEMNDKLAVSNGQLEFLLRQRLLS
ncbi:response regulator [Mucilaginibacter arboris]|uniref:Response regulator n=1 Tax=Mucilaginibacter arboris TaxID=2682090 RepID=A0A7K1SVH4_9SPHI|nr:response regulator [Mucilaginibacter arboris]MVN21238.1 response regulator [Mucilaginibacter arboris]